MANDYYDHTTYPSNGASGSSSAMRSELNTIELGFDKLPTLPGNGSKIVAVNSGGTALEAITTTGTGSGVRATSPTLVTPILGTPTSCTLTNCTGLPVASGISGLGTGVATALAVNAGGAGAFVVNGGALGTPSSGTLSSCSGLPIASGVSGLGANVATFLATPSSANLASAITDETGSGPLVFATLPQFTSAIGIGTAAQTNNGIRITSSLSGSVSQSGITVSPTFGSDGTTLCSGVSSAPSTEAAAFTLVNLRVFSAVGFTLGAGSSVTNYTAFHAGAETDAANHFAFHGQQAVVNASDRNCYMTGAAPNYFAGAVMVGSNTDDGVNLVQVNGGIVSKHATAGIGYATGAGGTVTQATNKATGVTLNKATGEITMNNAALNAATIVSFTLTDSAIAATDYLDVQHVSAGTLGAYTVQASCASGSATIYVRNTTAGALSEAIVLKFYLHKAVIA